MLFKVIEKKAFDPSMSDISPYCTVQSPPPLQEMLFCYDCYLKDVIT